jgi:hypothetical protein
VKINLFGIDIREVMGAAAGGKDSDIEFPLLEELG